MFRCILCVFAFVITTICLGSHPSILVSSIDEAVALANEIDSVALIVFTSDSCRYCIKLKKDLEHYPSMIQNKVVCYVEYDENKSLSKKYNVKTLPHSVILDNSNIVKEYIGYEKIKYSEWLK